MVHHPNLEKRNIDGGIPLSVLYKSHQDTALILVPICGFSSITKMIFIFIWKLFLPHLRNFFNSLKSFFLTSREYFTDNVILKVSDKV